MAIDELPEIGWTQRLKTNRVDECIALREIGEVTFFPGQKRVVYVGGVLDGQLYFSYGLDVHNHLEPPIQTFPLRVISSYTLLKAAS